MKKIFSFACIACIAISAVANVQTKVYDIKSAKRISNVQVKNNIDWSERNIDVTAVYSNGELPKAPKARKVSAAAALDTAFYFVDAESALYGGIYSDGANGYPTIWQKANSDVEFLNASMFNEEGGYGWFIGSISEETLLGTDTNLIVPAGMFESGQGFSTTPIFAMESGAQYSYGDAQEAQYWYAFDPEFYTPLTKSHMFTSTSFSKSGYDLGCFRLTQDMPYIFGTGIDMTPYASRGYKCGKVDTIGTIWGFEDCTTKIDSINIVVTSYATSLQPGNNLTMTLHPVRVSGGKYYIDLKSAYARHTVTAQDIIWQEYDEDYQETMGGISFPIKVEINGLFFITISGFNAEGANIGVWSDGVDPYGYGDTYYISNGGNFYNYWGMNALISVNAAIVEQGGEQAVENVTEPAQKAQKIVRDGQLIIKKGDKEFNVLGAQL